jgi:hypothetical protein
MDVELGVLEQFYRSALPIIVYTTKAATTEDQYRHTLYFLV